MRSLGGLLFFLGAGSVVLHLLGREFMVLAPLTPFQPWAGIIVAVIGVVLIFAGERGDRRLESETVTESRVADAEVVTRTTTTGTSPMPPADGPVSSPVGYGPPAEAGAAPGTSTTAAPGEATVEAERRYDTVAGAEARPDPSLDRDARP